MIGLKGIPTRMATGSGTQAAQGTGPRRDAPGLAG